jgi:hypothetical protein
MGEMDESVLGRQDGHDRAERERAHQKQNEGQHTWRMHEATEATPEMAAYFLGALRDQSSRAGDFRRQLRWQRLRHALSTEEAAVAEAHLIEAQLAVLRPAAPVSVLPSGRASVAAQQLTTSEARPARSQVAAG